MTIFYWWSVQTNMHVKEIFMLCELHSIKTELHIWIFILQKDEKKLCLCLFNTCVHTKNQYKELNLVYACYLSLSKTAVDKYPI